MDDPFLKRMVRAFRRRFLSDREALLDFFGQAPIGWDIDEDDDGTITLIRHYSNKVQLIDYDRGTYRLWPVQKYGEKPYQAKTLAACLQQADKELKNG